MHVMMRLLTNVHNSVYSPLVAVGWPCGVCTKGVGSNSLQCTSCQKWVHKKCSGIKGSML